MDINKRICTQHYITSCKIKSKTGFVLTCVFMILLHFAFHCEEQSKVRFELGQKLWTGFVKENEFHYDNVVEEQEALKHMPCIDINLSASPDYSKLSLLSSDVLFATGCKIYVLAELFDYYGKPKTSGGDQLRAIIFNKQLNVSAPGSVVDFNNGSYLLVFMCLWRGTSQISVSLAYTREAITTIYRAMNEALALQYIQARYVNNDTVYVTENAFCHPNRSHLLARTTHTDACNFTSLNSGLPWYCGKPKKNYLTCNDWTLVRTLGVKLNLSLTKCERDQLYIRLHQKFKTQISVYVREKATSQPQFYQPTIPCFRYNTTKLWYRKLTTGYFHNRKWQLVHCKGLLNFDIQKCMVNKTLYLFGDSTTRQWYTSIKARYNCKQYTKAWTTRKWKSNAGCICNTFQVILGPQCQPTFVGEWRNRSMSAKCISKRLDGISNNEKAIVVIHLFAHMRSFHVENFKIKIRFIHASVRRLLARNKSVKIFIKMPHTFTNVYRELNDFFGYVYTKIISEMFRGLYDQVIPLNQRDATNAIMSVDLHPLDFVVSSMLNQLFSYICK